MDPPLFSVPRFCWLRFQISTAFPEGRTVAATYRTDISDVAHPLKTWRVKGLPPLS